MTNHTLAQSYLSKAAIRLRVLDVFLENGSYSDVVREAQEAVELAVKGILRQLGIDPPKQHDVGRLLIEHKDKLPGEIRDKVERLAEISRWLRKEREFAFYGDIDFIPTLEYTLDDALRAISDARLVIESAEVVIGKAK